MAVKVIKRDVIGDLVLDEADTTWKLLEDVLVYGQVRSSGTPGVTLLIDGIVSSSDDIGFDIESKQAGSRSRRCPSPATMRC